MSGIRSLIVKFGFVKLKVPKKQRETPDTVGIWRKLDLSRETVLADSAY